MQSSGLCSIPHKKPSHGNRVLPCQVHFAELWLYLRVLAAFLQACTVSTCWTLCAVFILHHGVIRCNI